MKSFIYNNTEVFVEGEEASIKLPDGSIFTFRTQKELDDKGIGFNPPGSVYASNRKLPSRFQINSGVNVNVGSHVKMPNCKVIKIHFTESKVLYDVELPYEYDTPDHIRLGGVTRLYNIDSCFVEPANGANS